jgi:hypothetical protein
MVNSGTAPAWMFNDVRWNEEELGKEEDLGNDEELAPRGYSNS